MIFKGLLILFFIMTTLIAGGFLIAGLVKGKRQMWLSSLGLVVVSILGIGYVTLKGFSDSVDFVYSGDLGEKLGETVTNNVNKTLDVLARNLDIKPFEDMARKAGAIVGGAVKAAAGGMDGQLGITPVFKAKEIDALGISIGRADMDLAGQRNSVGLLLDFAKPFSGTLRLTAYDSQEQKMDVAEIELEEEVTGTQTLVFIYPRRSPGISGFNVLSAYPNR